MESDRVWLGAIYLKDEGGHGIVLRALDHYKKRLKTLGSSPELDGAAAMFSTVLRQQAVKTIPEIDTVREKLCAGLASENYDQINNIASDIPFIKKALACYKADIQKARDTKHEYFVKLVGVVPPLASATKGSETITEIDHALQRIKIFEA